MIWLVYRAWAQTCVLYTKLMFWRISNRFRSSPDCLWHWRIHPASIFSYIPQHTLVPNLWCVGFAKMNLAIHQQLKCGNRSLATPGLRRKWPQIGWQQRRRMIRSPWLLWWGVSKSRQVAAHAGGRPNVTSKRPELRCWSDGAEVVGLGVVCQLRKGINIGFFSCIRSTILKQPQMEIAHSPLLPLFTTSKVSPRFTRISVMGWNIPFHPTTMGPYSKSNKETVIWLLLEINPTKKQPRAPILSLLKNKI